MIFWFIAIAVTTIACAALFYAAGSHTVNANSPEITDANSHFGLVLAGIDADQSAGKLSEADALAAKSELARELLRLKSEAGPAAAATRQVGRTTILVGLAGVATIALGLYAVLGNPGMSSQPLAGRVAEAAEQPIDLTSAITRIEAALAANPDDVRGWTVIAPAYMELGRFADAANAYRRLIELDGASADLQTNLAEALIFQAQGAGSPEAMDLLRAAAASDPQHVLSRLYIAAELTRQEDFPAAIEAWNAALALSKGDEPWLGAARQGLLVATNDGVAPSNDQEAEMIGQMVSGLATRLADQGGPIDEWTQLVRAYLVLGDTAKAQAAFDDAVAAYPLAFDRGDLDTLALDSGLTINGASQ
ncbi:c-type cytochrome biogenesis protein CcmI [Devosia neptuniae]|jgi:cytochrome c-type biogenesis protein CcmH|uniref:c-type cytochrome biogenesis protein CcmI n=1 Tax=Devosia TaxID=46913 RepID=UPI0022AF3850|nr:c-type cytochrome biogenesis protein CcmI [Devosia neptuniae]MCZ4344899.1 c-type cytochrome biogenesis protein CcmI [Devosia neptuniae]|tara:strand:- start:3406 stop:4494 length:1089 start_codon:yes stop_codon:yes gene_type:complete